KIKNKYNILTPKLAGLMKASFLERFWMILFAKFGSLTAHSIPNNVVNIFQKDIPTENIKPNIKLKIIKVVIKVNTLILMAASIINRLNKYITAKNKTIPAEITINGGDRINNNL
ncbi:MAG: hypothetical protein V2B14_04075, partial [bacterium]